MGGRYFQGLTPEGKPQTPPFVKGPQPPGSDMGNMAGYDPLPKALEDPKFKSFFYTLDPENRKYALQHYAQYGNLEGFNLNQTLSDVLQRKKTELEFNKLEREEANAGKPAPETPEERMLGQVLGRIPTFEEQQKALEKAAEKRFQYDMMGRIPETIMAGLAGSGQLMREGAKDISNTVMRGVEALPKPNIPVRSYQNPTFRYFQ